jgi:CelD/BcsL family acetyltransferase involved in cellulose biosynthesis
MILAAITEAGYARVYVNDYYRQFEDHIGFDAQEERTSLVKIDSEEWRPPDKKLQSEIRKAQREEAVVREFALETDFHRFVELMQHTEKRHGRSPKYPPEFYHALARLATQDDRVRWLVCDCNGQLAASHIYLVESDQLLHWQAFFDKEYSKSKPNQAIMFAVVNEMKLRGVRVLNLGATPENAATLSDYKEKWGGETYGYPCLVWKSWLGRLL